MNRTNGTANFDDCYTDVNISYDIPPAMTARITYSAGCPYCRKCSRCNPNPRTKFTIVYNDKEAKLLAARYRLNKKLEEDRNLWPFYE